MSINSAKDISLKLSDEQVARIKELCRIHHVKSLFAFGSVTHDSFNSDSDIDFVVDIDSSDPIEYSENYFELKFKLQELLDRNIDLIEKKALSNPFLKDEIEQTKILVHEE